VSEALETVEARMPGAIPAPSPSEPAWSRRAPWAMRRALIAADAAGFALALLGTGLVTDMGWWGNGRGHSLAVALATLPLWIVAGAAMGLYSRDDKDPDHSTADELGSIVQLVTFGTWAIVVAGWISDGRPAIGSAVLFWAIATVTVSGSRALARVVVRRRHPIREKAIIVGADDVGQLVGRKLLQHPELGIRLAGFVDSSPKTLRGDLGGVPMLGSPRDIEEIVRRHDAQRVIVAFSDEAHDETLEVVRALQPLGVRTDIVPRLYEAIGPNAAVHFVEGLPLASLPPYRPSALALRAKRALDVVVAAVALVLTAPLFAWIAWRIKRDSPGPVFFRQERLTTGQRPFTVLKFRTMAVDTDDAPHRAYVREIMDTSAVPANGSLYKLDRSRDVTRVGAWLRRTSLDELPQLINVLRGDMSLVGPRPCLRYETELFEPHHFDRFLVPGGMTGLWQVAARAHSTMKEALELDVTYAHSWSLGLDVWLLARTPAALLRGKGTV